MRRAEHSRAAGEVIVKRLMDVVLSVVGLVLAGPILLVFMLLVWLQDFHSPLYIAPRVGFGGKLFRMVKIRSMISNADKSGVDSTKSDDQRITAVGHAIRKLKLDEITQLWNVLRGEMSLVGPRPQVERDVMLYTDEEKELLMVRPGITDFSSIVFADEGDILAGKDDPDLAYQQLIRPWKSRMALFYIRNRTLAVDVKLIALTAGNSFNRQRTLAQLSNVLAELGADEKLVRIARRIDSLEPHPPPGSAVVVGSR